MKTFLQTVVVAILCYTMLAQSSPEPSKPTMSYGNVDVLSDTKGVDFDPYLARVVHDVKMHWYSMVPEVARPPWMKRGQVVVSFKIDKDGHIDAMRLDTASGDVSLDRAAWAGITASNPLPPLPTAFSGQYLALRFHFYYNPDPEDLKKAKKIVVSPPTTNVRAGETQQFSAKITGTYSTVWQLSGLGCTGSACGVITSEGLYTAPGKPPVPALVTVTAKLIDDKDKEQDTAVVTVVSASPEK
jgi:TonB family protein